MTRHLARVRGASRRGFAARSGREFGALVSAGVGVLVYRNSVPIRGLEPCLGLRMLFPGRTFDSGIPHHRQPPRRCCAGGTSYPPMRCRLLLGVGCSVGSCCAMAVDRARAPQPRNRPAVPGTMASGRSGCGTFLRSLHADPVRPRRTRQLSRAEASLARAIDATACH